MIRSSPRVLVAHLLGVSTRTGTYILLVSDDDVAKLEDTVDIFGRLDDGLVLEYGRDKRMSESASCRIGLLAEKRGVLLEGEKSENGLVGVNGGVKQCREICGRLRMEEVGAERILSLHVDGQWSTAHTCQ